MARFYVGLSQLDDLVLVSGAILYDIWLYKLRELRLEAGSDVLDYLHDGVGVVYAKIFLA